MKLNHPNFINLLDYAIFIEKGICNTTYIL